MPGGAAYYAYLVERQTTTEMSPEEIHRLGLNEVARIKRGMEAIKARVGFKGSLPSFFDYIRNDPKFKPASAQALGEGYRANGKRATVKCVVRGTRGAVGVGLGGSGRSKKKR